MHGYPEALLAKRSKEVAILARREPSTEQIARRAHELYVKRGGEHGRDVEDWVGAEKELSDEPVVVPAVTGANQANHRSVN
jgi:hypothetical protein